MKDTPNAVEFIESLYSELPYELEDITELMIEFAKFHVEAALKAASENAGLQHYEFKEDWMEEYHNMETDSYGDIIAVDKDSILSAYPLTNIK